MSLDTVREKINLLDNDIKRLLSERFECSKQVALIKKDQGLPIFHPEREQQILDDIKNAPYEYSDYICEVYKAIMDQSKQLQKNITLEKY